MRRSLALGAAIVGSLLAAACGGGDGAGGVVIPEVYDLDHDPAAQVAEVDPARTDVLPAADLRITLESLLGAHGVTLVETMRAAARGDDGAGVWVDELVGNTDSVTGAVGLVYGPVGAGAFHQQWAQHTQFLVDYADAVRRGSDTDKREARDRLRAYAHDSGSLLSTALGGSIPADAIEGLLDDHVENMIEQIELYHDGDVLRATNVAIEDNAYLLEIAAALAGGFAAQQPAAFPGSTEEERALICSVVNRASGDLTLLALADAELGDADTSTIADNAAEDLDTALADLAEQGLGRPLPLADRALLVQAITTAVAASDEALAADAVDALRGAVASAAGTG